MKLVVRMQRCSGCNRLSTGRADREWCPDSKRMERQRNVYYYHRFVVVAFGFAVAIASGLMIGLLPGSP